MGKWKMVRLGDVCSLITKGTTPTTLGYNFEEQGVSFIKVESISENGVFIKEKIQYISNECDEKLKRSQLKVNDVLFSIAGALGRTAIVTTDILPANTNQALAIIRLDSKILNLQYVLKTLNSSHIFKQFQKQKQGVAQLNLSLKNISDFLIPLPPLEEQKRIAKNLDLASEIVKGYKEQIAELDKLVQSVFYEMFGESKTNPMQWQTKKLGEIGKVGSSKRVFTEDLVESGIPFYRGTEIGALATKRDINIEYFITQEHYNELCKASGRPTIGDLLMPSICNDGRIWRVDNDEPFYFKDGRVLWVHFSEQSSDNVYIQFALRERLISDYNNIASGTTFAELKIFALKNVDIMLPPLPLQTRFAAIVTDIEAQKSQVQTALEQAQNLFNSLMQEYFE